MFSVLFFIESMQTNKLFNLKIFDFVKMCSVLIFNGSTQKKNNIFKIL